LNKKVKKYQLWVGLGLVAAAILLVAVIMINAMKGKETGDVTISGGDTVAGLTCKDRTLVHPAFANKPANSYENTITAIFRDDKLSSISLLAEAIYSNVETMEEMKAFAAADYNLTLNKKYGEKSDIFSANFTIDGTKLQLAQTTRDISRINANTVTYFLLDYGTTISRSLGGLKKQYESKGFTCEKSK